MEKQVLNVPLSRHLLKPDDLQVDAAGNLKIDKQLITKLVKENINVVPDMSEAAVSVGVVVEF